MQNGPFDESKLKIANGGDQDSRAVENARDEKAQLESGETGGGVHVHVSDPVAVQTGFQSYDGNPNKEIVEVYDTISARPDTFHIITEAPLVRQEMAKEGVETNPLQKDTIVTGLEKEHGDNEPSDGLESYFGQLLKVTRLTNVDDNNTDGEITKNNQQDSHENATDNQAKLKDGVPEQKTPVGSTFNGPVKASRENESQTIGENSHRKQVETHATAKEALVGDSVNLKARDPGTLAFGNVQGVSTEATVIRYTWQNVPNERIDTSVSLQNPSTALPIDMDETSSNSGDKIIEISNESDFSTVPRNDPDVSQGSSPGSSNRDNGSHGSRESPSSSEKGESENASIPPITASALQDIQVTLMMVMICSLVSFTIHCDGDISGRSERLGCCGFCLSFKNASSKVETTGCKIAYG